MGPEAQSSPPEPESEPKHDMTAWVNGLQDHDPDLAGRLKEDADPYKILEKLELPVPSYVGFESAEEFLNDPEGGLEPLKRQGISNYYVGLRTDVPEWGKFRNEAPMPADQVEGYIRSHITPEQAPHYKLRVAEYVVAEAGMTMIINPNGSMAIDLVAGDLGPLATGQKTPEYSGVTDPDSRVLKYSKVGSDEVLDRGPVDEGSFLNTEMRSAVWDAVSRIKVDSGESDIRKDRIPGYFEVALVRHGNALTPLFLGVTPSSKGNRTYTVPEA